MSASAQRLSWDQFTELCYDRDQNNKIYSVIFRKTIIELGNEK